MPRLPDRPFVATAPTDRALLAELLATLRADLGEAGEWERNATVLPWQATAPRFEDLPERVLAEVLAAWAELGGRLAELELSGYLQTDSGPRAWGYLAVREAEADQPPVVARVRVIRVEAGYRVEAALRASGADDA